MEIVFRTENNLETLRLYHSKKGRETGYISQGGKRNWSAFHRAGGLFGTIVCWSRGEEGLCVSGPAPEERGKSSLKSAQGGDIQMI